MKNGGKMLVFGVIGGTLGSGLEIGLRLEVAPSLPPPRYIVFWLQNTQYHMKMVFCCAACILVGVIFACKVIRQRV